MSVNVPIALGRLALAASSIGVLCSTGYLVLALRSAFRFRKRARAFRPATDLPGVSVMKPLCGMEPDLEKNLESFFIQDHGTFELLFGTRDDSDPALDVVNTLRARHPHVPVRIVYSGQPTKPNAKVCTLEKMFEVARSENVIISDSDVRVTPDYLRAVTTPLLDPEVGVVTCLYRGVPTGGAWATLEALGMSVEMSGGVLVAGDLAPIDFALGPSMSTRKEVVAKMGGISVLADYCADDYVLGNMAAKLGYKVVISEHVIEHYVLNRSLKSSLLHQARWARSTRFSLPAGHLSSALSYSVPFGLGAAISGALAGMPKIGAAVLLFSMLNRILLSLAVGWGVTGDKRSAALCWLYPFRDLLGFAFWLSSYFGNTVDWRGAKYQLLPGGRMLLVGTSPKQPESEPVAVDDLP